MLRELHITNLAIIEDVHVEFDDGLTVFTGTTGAGKSLVVGALQLLLGMRSAKQLVRSGAKEGRISGLFDARHKKLRQELACLIDMEIEGDEVLITRRILASGRGSCTVNGQPVTVGMLEQLGERLVDLHGQRDHQYLLRPANQVLVIDTYAGNETLRETLAEAYAQWHEHLDQRQTLAENADLRRQQLELYAFQAKEIDEAAVREGELVEIEARHRRLANIDRIRQAASTAYAALTDDEGLLDGVRSVVADLRNLVDYDPELSRVVEPCEGASLALDEAASDLRRYVESLEFDPAELDEVEARLNLLRRLCDKYGGREEALLAHREQIERASAELRQQQDDFERVDEAIAAARRRYDEAASQIAKKRATAARKLARLINQQLGELGMDKARLEIEITEVEPGPTGRDTVEMMVRTNPGQPVRPLREIASGGELSRVMLAIKSALVNTDRISVLVFDEVDAHVGGRLGSVIGEKLRALASKNQVICITHLPQIAAYATRHLKVQKVTKGGQTRTSVQAVEGDDRVDELAEMIAGADTSATSRRQAQELLERACG